MKFRSKFEEKVYNALPPGTLHEPEKFKFPIADPGYRCRNCGSKEIARTTSYLPDFKLPNGTWVEAKGRLTSANRRRLVAWKAAFPNETMRIVFMANNWLFKGAKTRYSHWAEKAGFEFVTGVKRIPQEWFK